MQNKAVNFMKRVRYFPRTFLVLVLTVGTLEREGLTGIFKKPWVSSKANNTGNSYPSSLSESQDSLTSVHNEQVKSAEDAPIGCSSSVSSDATTSIPEPFEKDIQVHYTPVNLVLGPEKRWVLIIALEPYTLSKTNSQGYSIHIFFRKNVWEDGRTFNPLTTFQGFMDYSSGYKTPEKIFYSKINPDILETSKKSNQNIEESGQGVRKLIALIVSGKNVLGKIYMDVFSNTENRAEAEVEFSIDYKNKAKNKDWRHFDDLEWKTMGKGELYDDENRGRLTKVEKKCESKENGEIVKVICFKG